VRARTLAREVQIYQPGGQLVDDGVHRLHAATGKASSIADALLRLAADPDVRTRMGEAARRRAAENYSVDKVISRYEAWFEETLASAVSRRP